MISILVTILLPISFGFSTYFFYRKKLSSPVDVIIFTLATSISVFTLLASYISMFFSGNLRNFLFTLFIGASFGAGYFVMDIPKITKGLFKKRSSKEKLAFMLVMALVVKTVLLYSTKPIIDADIVSIYLPFARSIHMENKIPSKDIFTNNPMLVPPIGGPILLATSYAATNSINAESFKLYTLPFFIGMILLIYQIGKKMHSSSLGLIAAAVFLGTPIQDELLISWTLYPDIIMAFLFLFIIYLLNFHSKRLKLPSTYFLMGVVFAAMLLLKVQALFFIYACMIVYLHKTFTHLWHKLFIYLVVMFPILFKLIRINGITLSGFNIHPSDLVVILIILHLVLYLWQKKSIKKLQPTWYILITIFISALGLLWLGRNIHIYNHPLTTRSEQYIAIAKLRRSIRQVPNNFKKYTDSPNVLSLFYLSLFGTAFAVPKIFALRQALSKKHLLSWVFIILYVYILIYLYYGSAQPRYLYPLLPFMSLFTAYGIYEISKKFRGNDHKVSYLVSTLLIGISFFQSKWLWWISGINAQLYSPVAIITTLIAVAIILLIYFVYKKEKSWNHRKSLASVLPMIIIFPYLINTVLLSGKGVLKIPTTIEGNLNYYQGELSFVIPYINQHKESNQKIIKFGPHTGTAYKAHMPTINIFKNQGLLMIGGVFFAPEHELVDYIDKENISYALITTKSSFLTYKNQLSQHSKIFSIIENKKYFQEITSDVDNIEWRLYRRNKSDVE